MPWNQGDVQAAVGYYLISQVDPRIAPGYSLAKGAVVSWAPLNGLAILLQKQSPLNGSPTAWVIIPGTGGGGGGVWGAPTTVQALAASGAILPTTSLVNASAAGGSIVLTLPAPGAALMAVAVSKQDGTANTVTIATPSGLINGAATAVLPGGALNQFRSLMFISDLTNWTAF